MVSHACPGLTRDARHSATPRAQTLARSPAKVPSPASRGLGVSRGKPPWFLPASLQRLVSGCSAPTSTPTPSKLISHTRQSALVWKILRSFPMMGADCWPLVLLPDPGRPGQGCQALMRLWRLSRPGLAHGQPRSPPPRPRVGVGGGMAKVATQPSMTLPKQTQLCNLAPSPVLSGLHSRILITGKAGLGRVRALEPGWAPVGAACCPRPRAAGGGRAGFRLPSAAYR